MNAIQHIDPMSYLAEVAEAAEAQSLIDPGAITFPVLRVFNPHGSEVGGVKSKPDEFMAEGFPAALATDTKGKVVERGHEELEFYPLILKVNARVAFMDESGVAVQYNQADTQPPACMSIDGKAPVLPLTLANKPGQTISSCVVCPYAGFGRDAGCKQRGFLYGLARIDGGLYPFVWRVPSTSCTNLAKLASKLNEQVLVGDKRVALPNLRLVRVTVGEMTSRKGATYKVAEFDVAPFTKEFLPSQPEVEEIKYQLSQASAHLEQEVDKFKQNRTNFLMQANAQATDVVDVQVGTGSAAVDVEITDADLDVLAV